MKLTPFRVGHVLNFLQRYNGLAYKSVSAFTPICPYHIDSWHQSYKEIIEQINTLLNKLGHLKIGKILTIKKGLVYKKKRIINSIQVSFIG